MKRFIAQTFLWAVKFTAWRAPKYGVVFGQYFPVFGLDTGKYGAEITLFLDTFHPLICSFLVDIGHGTLKFYKFISKTHD